METLYMTVTVRSIEGTEGYRVEVSPAVLAQKLPYLVGVVYDLDHVSDMASGMIHDQIVLYKQKSEDAMLEAMLGTGEEDCVPWAGDEDA